MSNKRLDYCLQTSIDYALVFSASPHDQKATQLQWLNKHAFLPFEIIAEYSNSMFIIVEYPHIFKYVRQSINFIRARMDSFRYNLTGWYEIPRNFPKSNTRQEFKVWFFTEMCQIKVGFLSMLKKKKLYLNLSL